MDEKKLMIESINPAPRFHVNMQKKQSLSVANFTCFGSHNEDKDDITLLRSYVNEMLELKRFLLYAINDAFTSLIMWRGQLQVGKLMIPANSAMAFFGGIYVVENPHLIPGCFFLTIAWIMIASLNSRMHHPNPWHRTMPFSYYLSLAILGKANSPQVEIKPMEFDEQSTKYEINWQTRIETDLNAVNKRWELQLEMDKIGNENLETQEKIRKVSADPVAIAMESLASRLGPMQRRLR
jgi:hypothetical protein